MGETSTSAAPVKAQHAGSDVPEPAGRHPGAHDDVYADDAPAYVVSGDKAKVLTRLRRIEGQVRGLQRMVDDDTYCIDVLTQISAATSALESVALQLLDEHLHHCVRHAVEDGANADAKIAEASAAVARLVRS